MKYVSRIIAGNGGVEGYNQITLTYDEGSQEIYAEQYSDRRSVTGQGLDVIWHEPSGSAPIPVNISPQNKDIYLETAVLGDTTNDVIAAVNALKRMIRRASDPADEKIKVKIEPDGSSYATYYNILFGYVDDSAAYYKDGDTPGGQIAKDIMVILTCEPYGYGDTITLANGLGSSPHFVEDSDSDGLADGWTKSGTPTCTVNLTNYLTGGVSQNVAATTTGHGIISGNALSSATFGCGIWIYIESGTVFLRSYNVTDAATVTSKTINATTAAAAASATYTDAAGQKWYKIDLSGSTSGAKNVRIEVVASGGAATFNLDNAYFQDLATSYPPGFSSTKSLLNRYDPSVAAANINYLDIWGIPGDAPAYINIETENGDGAVYNYAGSVALKGYPDTRIFRDSTSFSAGTGTWTTGTTGSPIGGSYKQTTSIVATLIDSNGPYNHFFDYAWRVFAKVYSTASDATFAYRIYSEAPGTAKDILFDGDPVSVLVTSQPTYIEVARLAQSDIPDPDYVTLTKEMLLVDNPSAGTVRFDGFFYLPTNREVMLLEHPYYATTPGDGGFRTSGELGKAYATRTRTRILTSLAVLRTVEPGPLMTRIQFLSQGTSTDNNICDVADTLNITLTVTPRTSHLLGVS